MLLHAITAMSYYLTANNPSQQSSENYYFSGFDDMLMAYQQGQIGLHTFAWVRFDGVVDQPSYDTNEHNVENNNIFVSPYELIKRDQNNVLVSKYIRTTPGRILLNESFI